MSRTVQLVAILVVGVAIGLGAATFLGGTRTEVGRIDVSASGEGTAIVGDHDFLFAGSTRWRGTDGSWRQAGQPDCLPPESSVDGITFGVRPMDGLAQVVWVDCGSVAAR